MAKILKMFAAEFKIAALKIGVVDKSVLSAKEMEALADLPSREVLLAQLLGLLLTPATKLVRLLNEPARRALGARSALNAKAAKGRPESERRERQRRLKKLLQRKRGTLRLPGDGRTRRRAT